MENKLERMRSETITRCNVRKGSPEAEEEAEVTDQTLARRKLWD